jgi:hypothetical protein
MESTNSKNKSMEKADLYEGIDFGIKPIPGKGLAGKFIRPPFSVLRAMEGDWMRRKRQWIALGIESEVGRGAKAYSCNDGQKNKYDYLPDIVTGTSVFDPTLCELMYAWFCPKEGQVVDPFAGGSVRGIVAAFMGLKYWGSELRPEQVEANYTQGKSITPSCIPEWVCGDALQELKNAPDADFIFSCPPYGNLEVYSDMEEDISNMGYPEFIKTYNKIIRRACRKLKEDRFACFVVANFRDKKTGFYYDFVGDTVKAFAECGVGFYNEAILVTATGSLPVRVGRQFTAGRKLGKTHQNILIFYKGNPKNIKEIFNT